jgi:hypothetical protein
MELSSIVLPAIDILDPAIPCSRCSSSVSRGWKRALIGF